MLQAQYCRFAFPLMTAFIMILLLEWALGRQVKCEVRSVYELRQERRHRNILKSQVFQHQ